MREIAPRSGGMGHPTQRSPATFVRDVGYLQRYLLPAFADVELGDIDVTRVRNWVADLSASGLAPATVVKAAQILSKVMRSAVRAGLLRTSPCAGVRLPRIERPEIRFLSPSEVSTLASRIDERYRAVLMLGAYGGLRAGELFALRVGRVDLAARTVDVLETLTEVSGRLHFGPPKTKAGRRRVPLPFVVVDALQNHLDRYGPDDLVFTAPGGGPVRLASWRRRFFIPATKAAGVAPLRVHDLRHTAVALWIAAGASPTEIAARAGHSSVSVVPDRYGHLLPGSGEKVNAALDRLAAGGLDHARHSDRARIAHGGHRGASVLRKKQALPGDLQWALRDLNPRPQPCEGCALTT